MKHRRAALACLVAYAVASVADVVAQLAVPNSWIFVLPVVLMPLLAASLLLSAPPTRLVRLLLVALGFSWLGDWLGLDVLVKIACFLGAQIAYSLAFRTQWRRSLIARPPALAAYGIALLAIIGLAAASAGGLAGPVALYGLSLALMVALATGVNRLTAAGAVLFLLSDVVLGYDYFISTTDSPAVGALNMAIYLPAQLLIVLGVLQHTRSTTDQPAGQVVARAR